MQIKLVDKHEDGSTNSAPVELHGPKGYLAGWSEKVLHPSTKTLEQCVSLNVVGNMCQVAFDAGYDEALNKVRKSLGINK